jgi:uracil-DNA glycosylase
MSTDKAALLAEIAAELEGMVESPLYALRREKAYRPVVGEGNPDAHIMFVGEAPGEQEARKGRPFVGAAGRVLDELLASIGLDRSEVYITNVVKDRPPGNRDPLSAEIHLYGPILVRQIEIIRPRVIATLGRFALAFVLAHLGSQERPRISDLHGRPLDLVASYGPVAVVPLYHPASAFYADGRVEVMAEDFQVLQRYV